MSFEIEFATPAQALPTTGLSHQTSWTALRQPSRRPPSPPFLSSSPPRDVSDDDPHSREKDISNDENISVLDPRRFTPNLHASLVSEILSLRREVENKNSILGTLEENLHDNKTENDQLKEALKSQMAEVRSVKSQMHSLETGTLAALGELAKERDGAIESLSDTQKRLEASKIKTRRQEEEIERNQGLWDRDRQVWDDEKRNMERKIHVVEGRLRTVLTEVAATQPSESQLPPALTEFDHGVGDTWFTKISDSPSNRPNSVQGYWEIIGPSNRQDGSEALDFRLSTLIALNGFGTTEKNELSLAEELEMDEDKGENGDEFDIDNGLFSSNELPEEAERRRRCSLDTSRLQKDESRNVLGPLPARNEPLMVEDAPAEQRTAKMDGKANYKRELAFQYKDIGVQYSAPASPKLQVHDVDTTAEKMAEQTEHTANQRKKRVSVPSTVVEQAHSTKLRTSLVSPMVSAGCQTLDTWSISLAQMDAVTPPVEAALLGNGLREMKCATTQTNDEDILMMIAAATRDESLMTVPIIAIHPPGSRPSSSHNGVVLPPRTKSVGCQASIDLPISVRSISVQTEEIHSDTLPPRIPPRLLSAKATSRSKSWRPEDVKQRNHVSPRKSSRRNYQRPAAGLNLPHARAPIKERMDWYPGNNDNGPLNQKQSSNLRRPVRKESLFAGFESPSDGEAPAIPEIGFSDDDFITAAPIRKTLSKVQNSWKLVPHTGESALLPSDHDDEGTNQDKENEPANMPARHGSAVSKNGLKTAPIKPSARPPRSFHVAREPNIRRAALISSGTAAHTTQTRNPGALSTSNKESVIPPPFPVPTRSSSRRIPISASDGARSPTPYSATNLFPASNQAPGRPPSKNVILRKVQSATADPRFGRNSHRGGGTPSPPPSSSSLGPESPRPPRLPLHDISSRRARNEPNMKDLSPMSSLDMPLIEDPIETCNQSTNVVDAIAQTMVGEWMWKYVRRRKSFGVSESPQIEFEAGRSHGESGAGSGIRHKRWVWLAPYERAIMWSSKQPTSGPALLGKSGRKRKWEVNP